MVQPPQKLRQGLIGSLWRRYLQLLRVPLRFVGALVRTFTINRDRVARVTARERVAAVLKVASVLTVLAWIAIWLLAGEAQRNRLTEAVESYLAGAAVSDGSERE
jgi:hypothetical protein